MQGKVFMRIFKGRSAVIWTNYIRFSAIAHIAFITDSKIEPHLPICTATTAIGAASAEGSISLERRHQ